MKKIFLFTIVILLLSLIPPAYALEDLFPSEDSLVKVDWDLNGEAFSRIYFDTEGDGQYEDNGSYDSWIKFENKIAFKDNDKLFFKADVKARAVNSWGGKSDSFEDVRFDEVYARYNYNGLRFVVGQQYVTWGKMDDAVILDIVNAQDFRQFFLYDKNERKIPTFMFDTEYYADNWQLEALYMPFVNTNEVDFFESDFSVFGHIKRIVDEGAYAAGIKNLVSQISIEDKDQVTDNTFNNSQVALRFRSTVDDIDFGFYFLSMIDPNPTLREKSLKGNDVKRFLYTQTGESLTNLLTVGATGNDLVLEEEHPRINVVGVDFETVAGNFGVRGEMGYFSGKGYLRDDFSYTQRDQLSFGLGIDHTTAQDIYWNIQFIEDILLTNENLYAKKKDTHSFVGSVSKPFMRGKIFANLDYAYNLSWHDWMINPEVKYDFSSGLNSAVGLFIFGGNSNTLFGRYNDKDLAYISMKYSF